MRSKSNITGGSIQAGNNYNTVGNSAIQSGRTSRASRNRNGDNSSKFSLPSLSQVHSYQNIPAMDQGQINLLEGKVNSQAKSRYKLQYNINEQSNKK